MQTALILMTILGCDDSATQCHYIATAKQRWPTIALCDAASEKQLENYSGANYPVIVGVCQQPEATTAAATPPKPAEAVAALSGAPEATPLPPATEPSLVQRALSRVKSILPGPEGLRAVMRGPVHFVSDSYSWVARKIVR